MPAAESMPVRRNSAGDDRPGGGDLTPKALLLVLATFARSTYARRDRLGGKHGASMPKRLRLVIYKNDAASYRYLVHGSNPSIRGRFQTPKSLTGDSEIAAVKSVLSSSRRLEPFLANLKVMH